MSSDTSPYEGIHSLEVLQGFHEGFAGLIDIAENQGPTPGEIEGYKYCQAQIQTRINQIKGQKPTK